MKKILLLLIMLSMQMLASAQVVMGIDLNVYSTYKQFGVQMQKKGYKPFESIAGIQKYKVTYAGYKNCELFVRYDQANGKIYEVAIYMNDRTISEKEDIYEALLKQFKA